MSGTFIKVQTEDFEIGRLSEQVRADDATSGAIVTFTGIVREMEEVDDHLKALYLEHYPGMTEKALEKIADQARERWDLGNIIIVHRVGELPLNANIVFVGVGSAHRDNAFLAARFIMDYLKRDAPFWKKEITGEGEQWVEQKSTDINAANDW
ncbi:molybdopterin synthase catalytic subunit MoaE [Pontibacterium granulatum]|uniref:molybdopterin synthase catalytic subunit MoaE n=1 Tax=Pontibacterium granulatum TaxID=2036029 RepID=UPI00249ABA4D|nr:molybdopterin synthase catalytic subunit MoaE [Pontibacterium granulatum]MDI3324922.1 molybdopterin synthase catalytic subunit MoaE [Pontibacterium granulatum]